MPRATVNGIEIDYLIEGDGPETIVMVNGLADEKESWGYQTPDFVAAGYQVLTFDNRGRIGRMPLEATVTRQMGSKTAPSLPAKWRVRQRQQAALSL